MNYIKILSEKEKQKIENQLNEQFGISEIPGIIVKRGAERLFLFSGDYSENEIINLERTVPIERVGVYLAKIILDKHTRIEKIRLSIEGTQILGNQVKKNLFEIPDNLVEQWMKGEELLIKTGKRDFLVMKYKDNFMGCGKASEEKIGNFIPKSRRLRERGN